MSINIDTNNIGYHFEKVFLQLLSSVWENTLANLEMKRVETHLFLSPELETYIPRFVISTNKFLSFFTIVKIAVFQNKTK